MSRQTDHAAHRIKRIFAFRDDRLIVLLHCTPQALASRDTLKRLHMVQSAYADDLEIVPLLAAKDRRAVSETAERKLGRRIRLAGFALAVEHAPWPGSRLPSSWWMWDGRTPHRIASDAPLVGDLCPPAPLSDLGWALPLAEGECLADRLAALNGGPTLAGGRGQVQ